MPKKIKSLLVVIIITASLISLYNYNSYHERKQLMETKSNYIGMLNGIEKNSQRLENNNYYARLYHESNFPEIQEYNIICIYNNEQVKFRLNGEKEEFVHNIKCQPYSKNHFDVQIKNIKQEVNDFTFLFAREPYRNYDELIIPVKLNIASRSMLDRRQDSFLDNINIVPAETNIDIYPGVWIIDPSAQHFIPSIYIDITKNKILSLAYKGKSNTNVCFIPFINYRQTNIKINNRIMSSIKLSHMQKGGVINFELVDELKDNSVFFIIAIEKPLSDNISESVLVSNRTTILSK